jgi:rhodanese-related sulfurtransferase
MYTKSAKTALRLGTGILAAGLLPVLLYWHLFLRAPSLSVDEARALLAQTNASAVLVDVRSPEAFASNHLAGAVNWPGPAISSLAGLQDIPAALQGKKLLLLCNSGLSSALATDRLRRLGRSEVFNVSGGLAAWNTILNGKCSLLHVRQMTQAKQWVAVITAFGVKPLYMLISFGLILWLWRQQAPDLTALRWGLIIFWLGENACSVNYLFFHGLSDLWEFLHNYGMAVGFSFMAWAFLEGLDVRVIKYSPAKERCAALSLCQACIKYADAPCGLQRLFKVAIPAAIVVALMPLCAPVKVVSYNVNILGSLQNYSQMVSSQLFETRYCAVLAILLLATSWLVLLLKRDDPVTPSKMFFAAAMGPLGFGLMRLFLFSAYSDDLLWFIVWEEFTELVFVVGLAFGLWFFRESLFGEPPRVEARPAGGTKKVIPSSEGGSQA